MFCLSSSLYKSAGSGAYELNSQFGQSSELHLQAQKSLNTQHHHHHHHQQQQQLNKNISINNLSKAADMFGHAASNSSGSPGHLSTHQAPPPPPHPMFNIGQFNPSNGHHPGMPSFPGFDPSLFSNYDFIYSIRARQGSS